MRFVFAASVVLLCFVGWSHGYLFPVGVNSLIKRSTLERVPRQIDNNYLNNIIRCYPPGVRVQCESDLQPELVQNAINCGQNTVARYVAGSCDRNPSGDYCAEAAIRQLNTITNAITNCVSALSTGSCSSSCASNLRSLRNGLGCCINSLFNLTIDASEVAGNTLAEVFQTITQLGLFTYQLWSTCSVDIVGMCESSATVTPIHSRPVCTTLEYARMGLDIQCTTYASETQRIVDAIITAGGQCYELGVTQASVCSTRPDGQYCSAIVAAGTFDGTASVTPTDITINCNQQDQQSCSASCSSAIRNVANDLGCCFNSLYNTTSLLRSAFELETSSALWDQCGVSTPGMCENTVDGSPTTKAAMSLVVLAVLAALVQYVF